jgi:flagellin
MQAMERLSSTLRINSAKDDAAGLAIATRLNSQIRGLSQAVRNANDGISIAQTAEGAMDEVITALQRVRELSVQSAHGIYTSAERNAMNSEAQQLLGEINRISAETRFSTVKLLDGSFGTRGMHVGALANEVINMRLTSVHTNDILGARFTTTGAAVTADALLANDVTITTGGNTFNIGASAAGVVSQGQTIDSAWAKAQAINAQSSLTGVTATALDTVRAGAAVVANIGVGGLTVSFTVNAQTVSYALAEGATPAVQLAALRDAVNSANAGVTAAIAGNQIVLTGAGGVNIAIADLSAAEEAATGLTNITTRSSINLASGTTYTIGGANPGRAGLTAGAAIQGLGGVDISTSTGANQAIGSIDTAIATVTSARGDVGAVLNRLESTVRNLENVVQNITASRSRIMDADFAAETANLTKSMIMQQAGISVLSQANTLPQNVLALLGGR